MPNPTALKVQQLASRIVNRLRLRRKRAYVALLMPNGTEPVGDAAIVLRDLRDFCRGNRSSFDADPYVTALLEGRREVWLRIIAQLHLTEAQIVRLDPITDDDMGDDE